MNHPLSGLNAQMGDFQTRLAQKASIGARMAHKNRKQKRLTKLEQLRARKAGVSTKFGDYDFGSGFGGLGEADFSNQSIVNDFAGIGGEDDEALSGFGTHDEYLSGNPFKAIGKGFKKLGGGLKKVGGVVASPFKKVFGKKKTVGITSAASALSKPKTMTSMVKAAAQEQVKKTATGVSPSGLVQLAATKAIDTSIPAFSPKSIDTSIPQPAAKNIDSSVPQITNPSSDNSVVVSQGGNLTQAQVNAQPVVQIATRKSPYAHPLAIYNHPAASVNGFEGFFDDLKKKIVGDAKTAVKTAVNTGKTNLITGVTKSITGSDVVQQAAKEQAAQTAAEAAVKATQDAAKAVVAKTQEAVQYVQENKAKVAGISTAVLAAGALGAYFMFFRKPSRAA